MHLVLGDEELLVERAVAEVVRSARKRAGTDDVPVSRVRAGDVDVYELAELLSPSLSPTSGSSCWKLPVRPVKKPPN